MLIRFWEKFATILLPEFRRKKNIFDSQTSTNHRFIIAFRQLEVRRIDFDRIFRQFFQEKARLGTLEKSSIC